MPESLLDAPILMSPGGRIVGVGDLGLDLSSVVGVVADCCGYLTWLQREYLRSHIEGSGTAFVDLAEKANDLPISGP